MISLRWPWQRPLGDDPYPGAEHADAVQDVTPIEADHKDGPEVMHQQPESEDLA